MKNGKVRGEERGEIMLEGMITFIMTLFILIWLLGLGFLYYQRYVCTVVTNDVAVKIAATYNNPASDIIMGYTTTEDISNRDLYRGFKKEGIAGNLHRTNQARTEAYVKYMLDKSNFSNVVKDVEVKMNLVYDSAVRRHVEVVTCCKFNTPFGIGLKMFGLDEVSTYETTACADCTDIADYISTVDYGVMWYKNAFLKNVSIINSTVSMLNSLVKVFNHTRS